MIEVHYDDYEEDMDKNGTNGDNKQNNVKAGQNNKYKNHKLTNFNRSYVGIHTTAFKDFLLKQELMKAISTCGFEHTSEGNQKF